MTRTISSDALLVSKTGDVKIRAGSKLLERLGWVERDPNVPSRWRAFDFHGRRVRVGAKTRRDAVAALNEHTVTELMTPVHAEEHLGTETDEIAVIPEVKGIDPLDVVGFIVATVAGLTGFYLLGLALLTWV